MNLTVWKYTWPGAVDLASFEIPRGAGILHVHEQHDKICFWARVNPAAGMETRTLRLSGTGRSRVIMVRVGKKAAGRLLDGVEHNGMPVVA